jgi:hypothetical protein
METKMSKGVGERYFCIPESSYQQHIWMQVLKLLQQWLDRRWSNSGVQLGLEEENLFLYVKDVLCKA